MENRSLVTIAEHSKEKILYMLEMAKEFEAKPNRHLLDEKVVATLFFEPSTRTRLSFETAANRSAHVSSVSAIPKPPVHPKVKR